MKITISRLFAKTRTTSKKHAVVSTDSSSSGDEASCGEDSDETRECVEVPFESEEMGRGECNTQNKKRVNCLVPPITKCIIKSLKKKILRNAGEPNNLKESPLHGEDKRQTETTSPLEDRSERVPPPDTIQSSIYAVKYEIKNDHHSETLPENTFCDTNPVANLSMECAAEGHAELAYCGIIGGVVEPCDDDKSHFGNSKPAETRKTKESKSVEKIADDSCSAMNNTTIKTDTLSQCDWIELKKNASLTTNPGSYVFFNEHHCAKCKKPIAMTEVLEMVQDEENEEVVFHEECFKSVAEITMKSKTCSSSKRNKVSKSGSQDVDLASSQGLAHLPSVSAYSADSSFVSDFVSFLFENEPYCALCKHRIHRSDQEMLVKEGDDNVQLSFHRDCLEFREKYLIKSKQKTDRRIFCTVCKQRVLRTDQEIMIPERRNKKSFYHKECFEFQQQQRRMKS